MDKMMLRFARYLLNTLTQQQKELEWSFIKELNDRDMGFFNTYVYEKNHNINWCNI